PSGKLTEGKPGRGWATTQHVGGGVDRPAGCLVRGHLSQRLPPSVNSLFARVDLLAPADQAHAGTPVRMTTHQFQYEGRFRGGAVELLLTLGGIPGPLCLVEDDGVLVGWLVWWCVEALLQEVVDVLDAGADVAPNTGQFRGLGCPLSAMVLVEGEGFSKHD